MTAEIRAAAREETKVPDDVARTIKTISQADSDRIVQRAAKLGDGAFADRIKERFDERDKLLDTQSDAFAKSLARHDEYQIATENQPLLGSFLQLAAKAGHASRTLAGQQGFIDEGMTKKFGPALAKTMSVGDAGQGGNLVIDGTTLELWLEPLRAKSVVLSLNPEVMPVTGNTFTVDGFTTDPVVTFVEEVNTLPLATTPATGEDTTQMRKALMLLPITVDWRESTSPAVLRKIEDLSRAAFRVSFDLRYISGTGLGNSIKGMLNHISVSADSAGQAVDDVLADFETGFNSIESNNIVSERFGLFWSPRTKNHLMFLRDDVLGGHPLFMTEMMAGTFLGVPFGVTTNIPNNLNGNESFIILQTMNQFFVAQSTTLDLRWYENASFFDRGQLVSTIQDDTEVLRGRMKSATLMPHTTSGHVTTAVVYGT